MPAKLNLTPEEMLARRKEQRRVWNAAHREKMNAAQRKWRAANGEKVYPRTQAQKFNRRKYSREWFADNPRKRRDYNRKYYAANREKLLAAARLKRQVKHAEILEYNRQYRAKNPNCHREWRQKRKFREAWRKFTMRVVPMQSSDRAQDASSLPRVLAQTPQRSERENPGHFGS